MLRRLPQVHGLACGPLIQQHWTPAALASVGATSGTVGPQASACEAQAAGAVRRPFPRSWLPSITRAGARGLAAGVLTLALRARTNAAQRLWRRTLRARGGEQFERPTEWWRQEKQALWESHLELADNLKPQADQPQAIKELTRLLRRERCVTLAGATGTGKTFVLANVLEHFQRPALCLCHNKELAYQTYRSLQQFFPNNHVGLLTSPFKFYRPCMLEEKAVRKGKSYDLVKTLKKAKGGLDKEVAERRQEALSYLCKGQIPVIVASSTAMFPVAHPDKNPRQMLREDPEEFERISNGIQEELDDEVRRLQERGQDKAARYLQVQVSTDLRKLEETGWCRDFMDKYGNFCPSGWSITPVDLFREQYGEEWILAMDESHVALPHMRTARLAVNARKKKLVDAGFYLPSSLGHGPLFLEQLLAGKQRVLLISATPNDNYVTSPRVKMVQRPTHILDPVIEMEQASSCQYLEALCDEIQKERDKGLQVLVTTVTQVEAEKFAEHIGKHYLRADFVHSRLKNEERRAVMNNFRKGKLDVLVGVNLFREGMDFPRVSLVVVLDADWRGFLRTKTALIQTVGRAARNPNGRAILVYEKKVTQHMLDCVEETQERRKEQVEYNQLHGYKPTPIPVPGGLGRSEAEEEEEEEEEVEDEDEEYEYEDEEEVVEVEKPCFA